ncbi:MAG: ATP-binding cassette domain-containing protein, partial [Actinomycetia bacterium]|nr:ATP-binding cassette domain-containing protein [Actinomycetes bacterium]
MHLLSLESVSKSYPETPVLDNVSLGISSGERIGVIGRNGSGKSTLLAIIAGQEDIDAGAIVRARGLRVATLDQNPQFDDEDAVGHILSDDRRAIAIA